MKASAGFEKILTLWWHSLRALDSRPSDCREKLEESEVCAELVAKTYILPAQ